MISFFATSETMELGRQLILAFEILVMIISLLMIVIGLVQNKQSQTGLSALNGGNEELFSNSKERGLDKTLSIWMLSLGIVFFVLSLTICIITNTMLV
ncbi:preprotein translocase subunit SecG [Mycoplasma putrefaciens]|uniref:Protein-export membrane protein SecG n=1 Tax=Mycoplasma putrefaciens (strain ATCC 15718 / NCTC 10155 / C30 KS-1 / KS-1) TaxID=743965 RepID=A0A7U4E961_MYCPK|nr:preprotein translocase subunit SecG [Mycoplasma putrefaciens]AEM68509.1 preprotein translocase, SecG subunit [Mycoplasma putrefaciens KS1]SYV95084.1 preprotein translocase subunit SecG [Mycoplasma putrefaciens]